MKEYLTRRDFLKTLSVGAVGVAATAALVGCTGAGDDTTAGTGNSATAGMVDSTGGTIDTTQNTHDYSDAAIQTTELIHKQGGILTAAGNRDPGHVGPFGPQGRDSYLRVSYQTLLQIGPGEDGQGVNAYNMMAETIEPKGNGVYAIKLYDGIIDHNGNPFTSKDVDFCIKAFIEEGSLPDRTANFDHTNIIDDTHLEIVMKDPEQWYAFEIMLDAVCMVTQASYEASSDGMQTMPISTHAYKVTSYVPGVEIKTARWDKYWHAGDKATTMFDLQNPDEVNLLLITDQSAIAIALQTGQINITGSLSAADRPNFVNPDGSAVAGYNVKYTASSNTVNLMFIVKEGTICDDINLRKAFAYAIDWDAIAYTANGDLGHRSPTVVTNNCTDCPEEFKDATYHYFEYDPEKATEFLKQSNYKGETIRLLVDPNKGTRAGAVVVQSYLDAVGITVELLNWDNALYKATELGDANEYDIDFIFMDGSMKPTYKALRWLDGNNFTNGLPRTQLADPKLDELYADASQTARYYEGASKALIDYVVEEKVWIIPGYYFEGCQYMSSEIKSIQVAKNPSYGSAVLVD